MDNALRASWRPLKGDQFRIADAVLFQEHLKLLGDNVPQRHLAGNLDAVPALPAEVQARLTAAVAAVDVTKLPSLTPYATRPDHGFTL